MSINSFWEMAEEQSHDHPSRERTMTEKGKELFETTRDSLLTQLLIVFRTFCDMVEGFENNFPKSTGNIEFAERNLSITRNRYSDSKMEYLDFLSRNNSKEGNEAKERFNNDPTFGIVEKKAETLFDRFSEEMEKHEKRSVRTTASSASARTTKAKMEVEAAKAELHFIKQEVELKKKENEIRLQIEVLNMEKRLATKEAEAAVINEEEDVHSVNELPQQQMSKRKMTENYVESLQNNRDQDVTFQDNSSGALAQFLYRKDIVKDRLYTFNGQYEHYLSWKDTFKQVMNQINPSPSEELDLLVRWSGSGSRHILSIKTANAGNPVLGLSRAWDRLEVQFGSPERVEQSLRRKLDSFPKIDFKNTSKLFELADVLSEISSVKENPKYKALLGYLDTASGVNPTISKLPFAMQSKWRDRALSYKRSHDVLFPPFSYFCEFVFDLAISYNDPSFQFDAAPSEKKSSSIRQVNTSKTETSKGTEQIETLPCLVHRGKHPLRLCRAFKHKPLDERRQLLKSHGICFKCCEGRHLAKNCTETINCNECKSQSHSTAMHIYKTAAHDGLPNNGGESSLNPDVASFEIESRCTELCSNGTSKSCAKIVLVNVYNKNSLCPPVRIYALIDDQSNYSLAKPELFDMFDVRTECTPYSLRSCGGQVTLNGRRSKGFVIESLDGMEQFELPTLTECEMIPDNRNEIATPQIARLHPHLLPIADKIPPIDPNANILLLIGRDAVQAHHILDQRLGSKNQPFAQQLKLGWVIIGECCLDGVHAPKDFDCYKTTLQSNGRPSIMEPCENKIFVTTTDDNKPGLSWEDKQFISLMNTEMRYDINGHWEAPLPFKEKRQRLPNNLKYATKRTEAFLSSLSRDQNKRDHTLQFMSDLFENGHAERASDPDPTKEQWYLPLFGVYHPKKPDRIRIVFDSSAKFGGLSLNDVMMKGPNLTNNLLGVILRFRKNKVAVIADIRQMFYSFMVQPAHRDYLRFVWPADNDLNRELVSYRMKVHVFGNSPSPAVATFGLHKTVDMEDESDGDIRHFVKRNFYVDDALSSHKTAEEAINLLKRTKRTLMDRGNLRLHKICSNSQEVLQAFDKEDLANDLKNLDLEDDFPLQRSLGVSWNIKTDTFTFCTDTEKDVYTRRGVLSTINGIFDPLGLAAAFTITGKLLLREMTSEKVDWDEPLPQEFKDRWQEWKDSIPLLKNIQVPRMYNYSTKGHSTQIDLYIYSDASEKAIAAVAYIHSVDEKGNSCKSFILGKAKVAPKHGHTIPRLELCAAVLGVEVYETCRDELDMEFREVKFFTDSKVVLGYIFNETKRFYLYVGNRIDRIRSSSDPEQWNYVPSILNPADDASRGIGAEKLPDSQWLNGPVNTNYKEKDYSNPTWQLLNPEADNEIRACRTVVRTRRDLGCERFERFSSWEAIIRAMIFLRKRISKHTTHQENREQAENIVLKELQHETFVEEIEALENHKPLPKGSRLRNLRPYLDPNKILRVGGRLGNADLNHCYRNPIILPKHHVSMLIIKHYHEKTCHQGRHITEGAIRSVGYWILGGKRQISSYLHNCVQCRKTRGQCENQQMASLPIDRLEPLPPFTNVGIDVFGPWEVVTRKTRGGVANSKRWALMITCLVVRAVHIEILEEMTSSCFINALRRFCAIRGEVKIIRSDRGSNFIGSTEDLKANIINIDDRPFKNFLQDSGINWIFNPPHASHMGGAWERMIGMTRRTLDSTLKGVSHLTHDILHTLMVEVSSIINARPLTPVSTDPDNPFPLSPATLLTLKTNHSVKSFKLGDFNGKDLFKTQWRCVQHLANKFWTRWKNEYLPTLQVSRKWHDKNRNLQVGDIVLLRDKTMHRNEWPMGVIINAHPSADGLVRTAEVRLGKDRKTFLRPVTDLVSLITDRP